MRNCILLFLALFASELLFSQTNIDTLAFQQALQEFPQHDALVCIGEAHEVAGTYGLELYIIEALVKQGYEYIILEGGVAEAILINDFLDTGDDKTLAFTRARHPNYRRFVEGLRKIKIAHPSLQLIGVDFERGVCLEQVLPKWLEKLEQPSVAEIVSPLKKIKANTSAKKIKDIFLSVHEPITQNKALIEDILQAEYSFFHNVIFNPVFQTDFGLSSKKRDEAILKNLVAIKPSILKKSILIFGSNHFTNPKHFWPEFADFTRGHLESILILFAYYDCKNLMKARNQYSSNEPLKEYLPSSANGAAKIEFTVEVNPMLSLAQEQGKLIIAKLLQQQ